ncbi:MAG: hypothetical protein ACLUYZ_04435 [Lachnospiraceae bacterium]
MIGLRWKPTGGLRRCAGGLRRSAGPHYAFIGGSAGNMQRDRWRCCWQEIPHVRIVATAVSLESVAELTDCLTAFPLAETEVVSLQAARNRKAGQLPSDDADRIHLYFYDAGRRRNGMMWSLAALVIGFCIDLLVGGPHGFPHPVVS